MDPISNVLSGVVAAVLPRTASPTDSGPTLLQPPISQPLPTQSDDVVTEGEQKRYDAVVKVAQQIANTEVLGPPQSFDIYKDATGQLITRFTDKLTGKVTYIPEPQMARLGGEAAPSVTLQA